MRKRTPWWVSQFEDASKYREDYAWQEKLTEEQADFVARKLDRKGFLLDLGCGYGRHVKALAERGFAVVGVDRSKFMLDLARELNDHAKVFYLHRDMRRPGTLLHYLWKNAFHGVYNMFSSFGYFSDMDNRLVIREANHVLKKNGVLVLDLLNPELVKSKTYRHRVVVGSGRFHGSVRVYSREEMWKMLTELGFDDVGFYGWYDDSPYEPATSRRLLVVAKKRVGL